MARVLPCSLKLGHAVEKSRVRNQWTCQKPSIKRRQKLRKIRSRLR